MANLVVYTGVCKSIRYGSCQYVNVTSMLQIGYLQLPPSNIRV